MFIGEVTFEEEAEVGAGWAWVPPAAVPGFVNMSRYCFSMKFM